MTAGCSHLDSIQFTELPENIAGCEECLVSGSWWVHLRMCQSCGHIGCCDDSPNKHASAHFRTRATPSSAPPKLARTGATATSTTSPSFSIDKEPGPDSPQPRCGVTIAYPFLVAYSGGERPLDADLAHTEMVRKVAAQTDASGLVPEES